MPADHPIRQIKRLAVAALKELDPVFDAMHAQMGRPSTLPERLLKAQLLIAFYSIRSEPRQERSRTLNASPVFQKRPDKARDPGPAASAAGCRPDQTRNPPAAPAAAPVPMVSQPWSLVS